MHETEEEEETEAATRFSSKAVFEVVVLFMQAFNSTEGGCLTYSGVSGRQLAGSWQAAHPANLVSRPLPPFHFQRQCEISASFPPSHAQDIHPSIHPSTFSCLHSVRLNRCKKDIRYDLGYFAFSQLNLN